MLLLVPVGIKYTLEKNKFFKKFTVLARSVKLISYVQAGLS